MHPFTLLEYETYRVNDGKFFEFKKWYDELCYAQVNPETTSDYEEIKFLQTRVDCDRFLLMQRYFDAVNN